MDSYTKSAIKSISYRILATILTFFICFLLTRKINISINITLAELVTKVLFYYFHERLWTKILD